MKERIYGSTTKDLIFHYGEEVKLKTGKYKGYKGHIAHQSVIYHLNPIDRVYAVRVQTGTIRGWITIRILEKNLEKCI